MRKLGASSPLLDESGLDRTSLAARNKRVCFIFVLVYTASPFFHERGSATEKLDCSCKPTDRTLKSFALFIYLIRSSLILPSFRFSPLITSDLI